MFYIFRDDALAGYPAGVAVPGCLHKSSLRRQISKVSFIHGIYNNTNGIFPRNFEAGASEFLNNLFI